MRTRRETEENKRRTRQPRPRTKTVNSSSFQPKQSHRIRCMPRRSQLVKSRLELLLATLGASGGPRLGRSCLEIALVALVVAPPPPAAAPPAPRLSPPVAFVAPPPPGTPPPPCSPPFFPFPPLSVFWPKPKMTGG